VLLFEINKLIVVKFYEITIMQTKECI